MKKIIINSIIIFFFTISVLKAQNINWESFKETQNNVAYVNAGFDYGFIIDIGYGYKLKTKKPVLLNIDYSFPFGNVLFDDFKTKLGGQFEIAKVKNFFSTIKVYGIFRRYQNSLATLADFGSEFTALIGYNKPKWYVAAELGFDKAISTHIKNSALMKENFPGIQDGWYMSTGGNFFYGILSGFSFKNNDLNIRIGKTITQDFSTTSSFPIYLLIGFNRRF